MRWALIQGSVVANVVESPVSPGVGWVACEASVSPGAVQQGAAFVSVAPPRHITVLAFLSRFTDAEAVAVDLASIGATEQAAALRRYKEKVSAAKHIDLTLPATRGGVQALEAGGLIGAGRAAVILDAPIEQQERP